ncbi:MAG TPA: DUF2243 domain-containing protein [Burkholderiales bacterium]|nr:DUF2243 domain-containing protein [Burkholderiales bacterium]
MQVESRQTENVQGGFPVSAGILLGLGLGGFFDGIVLHQVLQWHHMVTSAGYPPDSVRNLEINTFFDGLFHAVTYVFVVAGLVVLWRHARRGHARGSTRLLAGSLLMGFGIFNLVEGVISHHLLGLHHVNETVPPSQWIYWDIGFLVWGALMLAAGWALTRSGRRRTAEAPRERPQKSRSAREARRRPQPVEAPIPMAERRRDWEPRPGGRRRSDPQPV